MATSLALMVVGGISETLQAASGSFRDSIRSAELQTRSMRALNTIQEELMATGDGAISISDQTPPGTAVLDLRYRPIEGRDAAAEQWGSERRLQLQLEDGELANGLDDNNNGLIDERQLVLTTQVGEPTELSRVVASGISDLADGETANGVDDNGDGLIDEPGFSISRTDRLLVMQLTVEALVNSRIEQVSASCTLRIRN